MGRKRVLGIWILSACVLLCPSYVRCQYEGDIRLVGSSITYEGRVEIYHSGQWGTVCDDSWDNADARVVCRQLGYSSVGATAWSNAYYGRGSGPIHLDDVSCTGYESRLTSCGSNGWGVEDCWHGEDAGVSCVYDPIEGDVRLVGGSTSYEGRVEIYHSGRWGTVCDDSWDDYDAWVVCRQLGYSSVGSDARLNAYYGRGSGPIHLDNVNCVGYESKLTDCRDNGWGVNNCGHGQDAGVYCRYDLYSTTQSWYTPEGTIRLVDGSTPNQGRVEIFHNGQWGTVCDDGWDDSDARVVCRQLGYSSVGADARSGAYYGQGSGPIHLYDVDCWGYESKLTNCSDNGWGVSSCGHSEDAGVYCGYDPIEGAVRLVGGSTSYEGRVEIYHSGRWGTVCDDSWDDYDARVVCRQLGYSSDGADARSGAYYGRGSGPIHLDNVRCRGYESKLTYCSDNGWGVSNCGHSEDAGVYCGYVTTTVAPRPKVSSKVVSMMSFVGVSLSLLTLVAIIAVCYTCNASKPAVTTSPTEELPLSTGPGHLAASNTAAAPTTTDITCPPEPTQPSMPPPSQLSASGYPPAAESDPPSAPPAYESAVQSSNPLPPPN